MICATCCALDFASDDQLRALVFWQAQQIHRLTGGQYEPPDPEWLVDDDEEDEPEPAVDARFVLEALLGAEDVFRKPPRVAAPRIIERLAAAGIYLTTMEEA